MSSWDVEVGDWNEEMNSREVHVEVDGPLSGREVNQLAKELRNLYTACCDVEYTGHGWGGTEHHESDCPKVGGGG